MSSSSGPFRRRTFVASAAAAFIAACSPKRRASPAPASTSSTSAATPTAPTARRPTFVSAGPRDRAQVALTFHVSGDRALATQLLDHLAQQRVPITAFMVGSFVDANPDVARRIVEDGHEIANHTYTHLTFPSLSPTQMVDEVTKCRDALVRTVGSAGTFFRPSGTSDGTTDPGATIIDVAHGAGYDTVVGFDVDPSDYADPGATVVAQRTIDSLQNGSIVSLHFGHTGTIDALSDILTTVNDRGLTPVTLSTLLEA